MMDYCDAVMMSVRFSLFPLRIRDRDVVRLGRGTEDISKIKKNLLLA
jgi:hypothetical protein